MILCGLLFNAGRSHHGIETNVLDYDIIISEFKLKLYYYIHFQTNTLGKGMRTSLSPPQL